MTGVFPGQLSESPLSESPLSESPLSKHPLTESHLSEMQRSNALMRQVLAIGTVLSAESDLNGLLAQVVHQAKLLCRADAGVLYLPNPQHDPQLDCAIVQIDSLQIHRSLAQGHESPTIAQIPLTPDSPFLAAQAAITQALIHTASDHTASDHTASDTGSNTGSHDSGWSGERDWDQAYGYQSVSSLAVPLQAQGQVVAVLQVINTTNPQGKIVPFDAVLCETIQWFAAQAANVLNQQHLLRHEAAWAKGERELQIGRQIQLDFLPDSLPQVAGWEIAARFHPAREVAGDFYDAFLMGQGRIGIVIADVCDKGVGAALFMSLFRSFLRILAQQNYSLGLLDVLTDTATKPANSPAKAGQDGRSRLPSIGTQALKNAIERTNNYIAETHVRITMFATIFFGVLDRSTGKLIYINGGHEAPFVCNAQGIKERLQPTGPAVGIFPNAEFRIEMTQLEPGDLLLGYTDGIPDARNSQHQRYTEQRLSELITSASTESTCSALDLIDRIDAAVHTHIADVDPFDDITLIAVRRDF